MTIFAPMSFSLNPLILTFSEKQGNVSRKEEEYNKFRTRTHSNFSSRSLILSWSHTIVNGKVTEIPDCTCFTLQFALEIKSLY